MRMAISGSRGRMGKECARVFAAAGQTIAFSVDRSAPEGEGFCRFSDIPQALACDCIVDFSNPAVLSDLLEYAARQKVCAVLATTGFSSAQMEEIEQAATLVPLFISRNMSLGVNLAGRLCEILARALSPDYDVEIVETHHASKRDAPSGTALYLADMVKKGRGGGKFIYDRRVSELRRPGEIGIHSLRGGSVVGRHTVGFFGRGESIAIEHIAEDRELFARGALAAAQFLFGKEAGLYGMDDLVAALLKG